MNIQSKHPTTADEFLRWNEGREGKREFVRGKVIELMMINTTCNQDEPRVWLWSRRADGEWEGPLLASGLDQSIELAGLGITIGLAEVYGRLFGRPA